MTSCITEDAELTAVGGSVNTDEGTVVEELGVGDLGSSGVVVLGDVVLSTTGGRDRATSTDTVTTTY